MAASGPGPRPALSGGGALIFLTVGTHEPFDRLVQAVDTWAGTAPPDQAAQLFGQITARAGYRPKHFDWVETLPPADYQTRFDAARLIIAHAGMGSLISALTAAKPILILPRRAAFAETRNDHQFGTAQRFAKRPGVTACMDESEIAPALDRLSRSDPAPTGPAIGAQASPELIAALRSFITGR